MAVPVQHRARTLMSKAYEAAQRVKTSTAEQKHFSKRTRIDRRWHPERMIVLNLERA
jgi:hypothetical protein